MRAAWGRGRRQFKAVLPGCGFAGEAYTGLMMANRRFAKGLPGLSVMPPYKSLHRGIFREAQLCVEVSCIGVAVFGPLPEFTAIAALERHHVFLRLVDENAESFLQHLVWAHGYGHLDLADIPFLPGAFV